MPSSSYKVNGSPTPQHRVTLKEPITDDTTEAIIEEEEEVTVSSSNTKKDEPSSPPKTTTDESMGHSSTDVPNGVSNGHGLTNGKANGTGILKNKDSETNNLLNGNIAKQVEDIFDEVFMEPRGNWSNKVEFVACCLGFSIALSSFWRFPMLISEYGGGAFLFCYGLLLLLIGLPLYFMEVGLGQFSQLGCVQAWRSAPLMQGVGVGMLVLSLITSIYNSQLVAYVVHYFFSSFVNLEGTVLWGECRSSWESCHDASSDAICVSLDSNSSDANECWRDSISSSEYYWRNNILRINDLEEAGKTGPIHWDLALSLLFVWFFAFIFSMKGIRTSGKVGLFTGVVPYCILIAFLVAGINKPGAIHGLATFYEPDWDKLLLPEVWKKALEQVLLSLGATYGGIVMISSYCSFRNTRIQVDAIALTLTNLLISVAAATTLFAFCGVLAKNIGIDDPKVFMEKDVSGTELLFVFYPDVISRALPLPHVWAIFFFLMLLCIGLHAQFILVEVCLTTVYDSLPRIRRKKTLATLCLVVPMFLLSLPLCSSTGNHIFHLIGTSVIGPNVILLSIFEMFSIFYLYGIRRFCRDLKIIRGSQPSIFWKVLWMFITPVSLIVIFVFAVIDWKSLLYEGREDYPDWSLYLAWTLTLLPLAMIPLTFVFAIFYKLCTKDPLCQPSPAWGPGCDEVDYYPKSNSDTTSQETIENTEGSS